jgi:hypothetical protein
VRIEGVLTVKSHRRRRSGIELRCDLCAGSPSRVDVAEHAGSSAHRCSRVSEAASSDTAHAQHAAQSEEEGSNRNRWFVSEDKAKRHCQFKLSRRAVIR